MVSIVSLDPEGRSQISALPLTQVSPPPRDDGIDYYSWL